MLTGSPLVLRYGMKSFPTKARPGHFLIALLAAAVLFFGMPAAPAAAAGQGPMQICYPDFWPFFHRQDDGSMTGFFHDIVTEALDRMDIQATWEAYPWPRCQLKVQAGECDAMITFPSAERLQYADTHPDPFYEKKLTIFTYVRHPRLREIKSIKTLDDIRQLNLTVITYAGNGWNDKNIKTRGIKTYDTALLKNVWLMLANKRGDIVIEWPGGAWPDIYATGMENGVVQTDVFLQAMPFHLMIGKESPYADCLPRFNEIILQMRKEGAIDRIVEKYIKYQLAGSDQPPLTGPRQ